MTYKENLKKYWKKRLKTAYDSEEYKWCLWQLEKLG